MAGLSMSVPVEREGRSLRCIAGIRGMETASTASALKQQPWFREAEFRMNA